MDFVLSGYEAIMGNWAERLRSPFSLFNWVFENIFFKDHVFFIILLQGHLFAIFCDILNHFSGILPVLQLPQCKLVPFWKLLQ